MGSNRTQCTSCRDEYPIMTKLTSPFMMCSEQCPSPLFAVLTSKECKESCPPTTYESEFRICRSRNFVFLF